MKRITDLHMHIVPGIDDGAQTTDEALQMLKMSEAQGITDIFCTSHNSYTKEDGEKMCGTYMTEPIPDGKTSAVRATGCGYYRQATYLYAYREM